MTSRLFDAEFFRRLEGIRLHFARGREDRAGTLAAAREAGEGLEFHDYRGYAPGDDPRYIDWNAFARLGKTFLKRFRKEEGSRVTLILDLSASMHFGQPTKAALAKKLAGGLGFIALASGARLRCQVAHAELVDRAFEGQKSAPSFLEYLEAQPVQGQASSLQDAFARQLEEAKRKEIFYFSDLFHLDPLLPIMRTLRSRGHEVHWIHVLAHEEREPGLSGFHHLRDAETGEQLEVECSAAAMEQYHQGLESFLRAVERSGREHGIRACRSFTDESFEPALLRLLGQEGGA